MFQEAHTADENKGKKVCVSIRYIATIHARKNIATNEGLNDVMTIDTRNSGLLTDALLV